MNYLLFFLKTRVLNHLYRNLKNSGFKGANIEGNNSTGWIVIDCGDIIVHIFKKEIREFYNLEKMWSIDLESYSE